MFWFTYTYFYEYKKNNPNTPHGSIELNILEVNHHICSDKKKRVFIKSFLLLIYKTETTVKKGTQKKKWIIII